MSMERLPQAHSDAHPFKIHRQCAPHRRNLGCDYAASCAAEIARSALRNSVRLILERGVSPPRAARTLMSSSSSARRRGVQLLKEAGRFDGRR